jgi:nitrite reductase (NADH) small subunit
MQEVLIGRLDEFKDGDCRILSVEGFEVGVFRRGAKLIAYENRCPHQGGPVCQGKIFFRVDEPLGVHQVSLGLRFSQDEHIVCPWHGYEYSLESGAHPGDPRLRLRPAHVEVRDGDVFLRLPAVR